MSDYKESSVAGTSYNRWRSLYFENPRIGIPSLLVREETVVNLSDRVITEHAGEIRKDVSDLSVAFPMRNPATNEIIPGEFMDYQGVYVILFSLCWHLALERDEAANSVIEEN